MRKLYLICLFAAYTGLLLLVAPALAFGSAKEVDTKGKIDFIQDQSDSDIFPVDPLLPNIRVQAEKPAVIGDYSIIYASDYQFGSHQISKGNATYYAKNPLVNHQSGQQHEVPNFVEVLDRSGSKNGWRLLANFSAPLQNRQGDQIKGVSLTLKNIQAHSTNGFSDRIITINKHAVLYSDNQETVKIAEDSQGQTAGFWIITFGDNIETGSSSVSLFVPKIETIKVGSYSTSITWTFESAL